MTEILVYSGSHFPEGEFENLLNDLDRIDPDSLVTGIRPQQRGQGATWEEFVFIWILSADVDTFAGEVIRACVDWAKTRFEKEKPRVRPKAIRIYGPDGKTVHAFRMDGTTGEMEDETEQLKNEPPYLPPSK